MTIVETIETLTSWVSDNICPKVRLKKPSDENGGADYKVTTVSPSAFPLFQPTKEKMPPTVKIEFPSAVVQLLEGSNNVIGNSMRLRVQMSFTAWNPGTTEEEGAKEFQRNSDGWKDVWSFVDRALQEIRNAEYMNGIRLVKELGITFGQFTVEGQISDLYPYWAAWAIFTVETGVAISPQSYQNLL